MSQRDNNLPGPSAVSRSGRWDVRETGLKNPDFSEYAQLCGALGIRVTEPAQLDEAIGRALAHDGPSPVEIMADPALI